MLYRLTIHNVALIKDLSVDFGPGLNILSGETGAGKSIIVDSLMLLLGARYDKSILRFGESAGFVEGVFETAAAAAALDALGFDCEECMILTRRFTADGKNEIRLNGRQITLSMLKEISGRLIDIYGQGEYQSLLKRSEHRRILDFNLKELAPILSDYRQKLSELKHVQAQLNELGAPQERERNIDLMSYQLREIEQAAVKEGEEDELVAKRKRAASTQRITEALTEALQLLNGNNVNAVEMIAAAKEKLRFMAEFGPVYGDILARLESVLIELDDIGESLAGELGEVEFDENELEKLISRLDTVRLIARKYGDYDRMSEFYRQTAAQVDKLQNCDALFVKLGEERQKLIVALYDLALKTSKIRRAGAAALEAEVVKQLSELGMENSLFEVRFEDLPPLSEAEAAFSEDGLDSLEFYLSPNPGRPPLPLIKIISGGEMSRLMLALKVVASEVSDVPTMIFDEVDAGISGKVGQAVAQKLYRLAVRHQVLCVTHLPQIAAMADRHFFINKSSVNGDTVTKLDLLTDEGAVEEISRLSGGADISRVSRDNALEMKRWSDRYKQSIKDN